MADRIDDMNDHELDRAFRQGIEPMAAEPSDAFWQKAESGILKDENAAFKNNLFKWKTIGPELTQGSS